MNRHRFVLLAVLLATLAGCKSSSKPPQYTAWPFDAAEAARRQHQTAAAMGVSPALTVYLNSTVKMNLVLIPAGRFIMGSTVFEPTVFQDWPAHEVTLSTPFYMGAHHVTRGQFRVFVEATGYQTEAERAGTLEVWNYANGKREELPGGCWRNPGFAQTDDHPVVCIGYADAQAFCQWLSGRIGRVVTLPTEAQWEFACRAGADTRYWWGKDLPTSAPFNGYDQALFKLKPPSPFPQKVTSEYGWNDGYAFTSPVGSYPPNAFGLYDMFGNADQWCSDFYDKDYYLASPKIDPAGPSEGDGRVVRGGSWAVGRSPFTGEDSFGCYRRSYKPEHTYHSGQGFRVVCSVQPMTATAAASAPAGR